MNWTMQWLHTAFGDVVGFLPNLVAGLAILFLGYLISLFLSRAARTILRRLHFDRLLYRLRVIEQSDLTQPGIGPRWGGSTVFAVGMITTLMQVARAWRLDFVASGLSRLLAYLPHVLGAVLIFGAALFFGDWVRARILTRERAVAQDTSLPRSSTSSKGLLASGARGGILAVGSFMALRELQLAPEIVNIAFTLVLGAIAVAAAVAFGLGARDVAARLTKDWYERRGRSERMGGGGEYFRSSTGPS